MSPDMVETGSPEPEISKKFILTDRVDRADRVDTPQSPDQDDVLIIEDTPKSPEPETSTPGSPTPKSPTEHALPHPSDLLLKENPKVIPLERDQRHQYNTATAKPSEKFHEKFDIRGPKDWHKGLRGHVSSSASPSSECSDDSDKGAAVCLHFLKSIYKSNMFFRQITGAAVKRNLQVIESSPASVSSCSPASPASGESLMNRPSTILPVPVPSLAPVPVPAPSLPTPVPAQAPVLPMPVPAPVPAPMPTTKNTDGSPHTAASVPNKAKNDPRTGSNQRSLLVPLNWFKNLMFFTFLCID